MVQVSTHNGPVGPFAAPSVPVVFLDDTNITIVAPRQMSKREHVEPIAGLYGPPGQLARLLVLVSGLDAKLTTAVLSQLWRKRLVDLVALT